MGQSKTGPQPCSHTPDIHPPQCHPCYAVRLAEPMHDPGLSLQTKTHHRCGQREVSTAAGSGRRWGSSLDRRSGRARNSLTTCAMQSPFDYSTTIRNDNTVLPSLSKLHQF